MVVMTQRDAEQTAFDRRYVRTSVGGDGGCVVSPPGVLFGEASATSKLVHCTRSCTMYKPPVNREAQERFTRPTMAEVVEYEES